MIGSRLVRRTWFWLGLGLSLVCFWLAARQVSLAELGDSLAAARYGWLFPALAFQLLSILARSWRWVLLLPGGARLADSFWAQGIGYLFTNVFPLRLGEPARVLVMARHCRAAVLKVTASAIVERLFDAAINVLVLGLLLPWLAVPAAVSRAGAALAALSVAGLGGLLLLVHFHRASEKILAWLCGRLPLLPQDKILFRWSELVDGFAPLARWRSALGVFFWSLATWALVVGSYVSVLRAFQPDSRVVEAAFMMVTLSFAVAVPSSPGFVGIYQLAGQQALVLPFGAKYDPSVAFAITLTSHMAYFIPTTLLGMGGLWRLGESFFSVGRSLEEKTGQEQPAGAIPQRPAKKRSRGRRNT